MNDYQQSSDKPHLPASIKVYSKFHLITIILALLSFSLLRISPGIIPFLILLYLLLILTAPYFPRWNMFLPITCRKKNSQGKISLTFDDGPDPQTTEALLKLLKKYRIKASFFVIGDRIRRYPELARLILDEGHELGNHSQHHDSLLMLKSKSHLFREIEDCQKELRSLGIEAYAFRPPVGITNPKLFRILISLGMYCVAFNRRPRDFGNRKTRHLKKRVLKSLKSGDIVLLHDKAPNAHFEVRQWLKEIEGIILGAGEKKLQIVPVSELTGRPVMSKSVTEQRYGTQPSFSVFNYLAESYRSEGLGYPIPESSRIPENLKTMLNNTKSVLELGPGDGRMGLEVAKQANHLTVIDNSPAMLKRVETNAEKAGINNLKTDCQDLSNLKLLNEFDLVYAYSCLEYVSDLKTLFGTVYHHLNHGGVFIGSVPVKSISGFKRKLNLMLKLGLAVSLFSKSDIKKLVLEAGFSDLMFYTPVDDTSASFLEFSVNKH